MPSAYKTAVGRAVAALARDILDGRSDSWEAVFDAMRVFVGDPAAMAFPPDVVERVMRNISVSFGDRYSARLRKSLGERFGPEAAEVADRLMTETVAAALAAAARRLR